MIINTSDVILKALNKPGVTNGIFLDIEALSSTVTGSHPINGGGGAGNMVTV